MGDEKKKGETEREAIEGSRLCWICVDDRQAEPKQNAGKDAVADYRAEVMGKIHHEQAEPEPREVVCDDPTNDAPLTDEQRKAVEAYWRARIFDPSDYRK